MTNNYGNIHDTHEILFSTAYGCEKFTELYCWDWQAFSFSCMLEEKGLITKSYSHELLVVWYTSIIFTNLALHNTEPSLYSIFQCVSSFGTDHVLQQLILLENTISLCLWLVSQIFAVSHWQRCMAEMFCTTAIKRAILEWLGPWYFYLYIYIILLMLLYLKNWLASNK